MKSKRVKVIVLVVLSLLLIPFIAMKFLKEVNWKLLDFVVAGVLLFGTGLVLDLVLRKIKSVKYRIVIITVLLLALFLIWAELAVGIFDTLFN